MTLGDGCRYCHSELVEESGVTGLAHGTLTPGATRPAALFFRGVLGRLELRAFAMTAEDREVLHIEERDVDHEPDDEDSAGGLDDFEHLCIHRPAADRFDERQQDVP